jgi:tetratricopeptide (TPR) repeat protein
MIRNSHLTILNWIIIALLGSCTNKPICESTIFVETKNGTNCAESLEIGKCLHNKGDYILALKNYLNYLNNCEITAAMYTNISDCYYKLENDSMSEYYALMSISLDKTNIEPYFNLAVNYYNTEQFSKAMKIIETAPGVTEDAEFSFLAFEVFWNGDSLEKADYYGQTAILLNNDVDEYKSRYAAFLNYIGEYDEAIEISIPIFKRTQDTSYYHFSMARLLGDLYLNKGDTSLACSYYSKLNFHSEFQEIFIRKTKNCTNVN